LSARDYPSANLITFYTFLVFFGMTWTDTIIGGYIVRESRRDMERGAEDLRYFEWLCWAFGGIVPVLIGPGLVREGFDTVVVKEFWVIAGIGLLMAVVSIFLPAPE
jgi:hypothetical protein